MFAEEMWEAMSLACLRLRTYTMAEPATALRICISSVCLSIVSRTM